MFSDDGQSVGHSTSWHLATGTHDTLSTPLFYPPDTMDIIITMSQLRSLHAGERPGWPQWLTQGSQRSSAGPGPHKAWGTRQSVTWSSHQREVGTWMSPHAPCWWGKQAAETPQPLFSDCSSFLCGSCLRGSQRDSVQS